MRSRRELSLAILAALAEAQRALHKSALTGSDLQRVLGGPLSIDERALAARAFDRLVADGLIRQSFQPMADSNPEKWVVLTDAGRAAHARGELDDLDAALARLDPRFVEIRAGAWELIRSESPDAVRQAAHSGRELLNQVADKFPGSSFREQLKAMLGAAHGEFTREEAKLAEQSVILAHAALKCLTPASHERGRVPSRDKVLAALSSMDAALRLLLVHSHES